MVRVGQEKEFRDTKNGVSKILPEFKTSEPQAGRDRKKPPGSLLLQLLKAETKKILEPARKTSPASREISDVRAF